MHFSPRTRLYIAALFLAFGPGCDRSASKSGVSNGSPDEIKLGYFANLTHAQAVLGVTSGDFADAVAPARLTTRVFNAGPSLIEALFAGEVDVAYVGPGPALTGYQRSNGKRVRVVAGAASNGVVIVARKDLGITSFDQLKGRKIATPQHGNTQDISARHFLQARFGDDALAGVLPISNAEQLGMMKRRTIDAAWVPEPWGQRLISEAGATLVAEEKDLWPGGEFMLTVVITTPAFLERHPDIQKRILAAHQRWTTKLQTEPEAHIEALANALSALTGARLPEGVLPAALRRVKFTDEPNRATFDALAVWSNALGFSRSSISLDKLIDDSLIQQTNSAPATQEAAQ